MSAEEPTAAEKAIEREAGEGGRGWKSGVGRHKRGRRAGGSFGPGGEGRNVAPGGGEEIVRRAHKARRGAKGRTYR